MAPAPPPDNSPVVIKMLTAGVSGCVADILSFPLDTAKVRLQVQGEGAVSKAAFRVSGAPGGVSVAAPPVYRGVYSTIVTIVKREGPKALYNGLSAGLQRQMAFASVRIGLYDTVKGYYLPYFSRSGLGGGLDVGARIAAGITTGAMAVMLAQPTDVVKVRMQAQAGIYKSTISAYGIIAKNEGVVKGLWRGTLPNISRNAIINVAEIVVYDIVKDIILRRNLMRDDVPCHFISAVIAGFCATAAASPVDVVKTRFMNSPSGKYKGAIDCAVKMGMREGPSAFYKGFVPSFYRIVSWNIFMWVTYEQIKRLVAHQMNK